jgi:tetratricopeptide (TPR) repeat protein
VELSAPITAGRADTLSTVRAEQVRRWRAGERPPAEQLLAEHPELAADEDAALVLVYGEVLLREELDGRPPDPAEYAARFPAYAVALSRQFELHGALDPLAGPDLPGFEIVRELGRGGAGVVYLARDRGLGRLVAVKVLLSGEFASPSARQRFRTEAEAAAGLRHPNIVPVHAVGEQGGRPYLVFEFLADGSLDKHLAGTPLAPRAAAELLRPLADAVGHAHSLGIVHRDLKPGNILLASPGLPMISDFGLAKRVDIEGPTATSQVLGTPSYMAPEQATGAKDVGPAADVYALGAILYECLTGRPPFKAATPLETLAHVTGREPAAPRSLNPAVPRDLETICLKCLAKEPAKRYPSAGALADDLGRFLDGKPVTARPVGALGRVWRWAKRRPAVAALTAALAVLLPAALAGVTALYLHADAERIRAEDREREVLQWRLTNARQIQSSARALVLARDYEHAAPACRAAADEMGRLADLGVEAADCRARRAEMLNDLAYVFGHQRKGPEALQASDGAVIAAEAWAAEQPESPMSRKGLLYARHNQAVALRLANRLPEAKDRFDAVIRDFHAAYGPCDRPGDAERETMSSMYFDRGQAAYLLGRYAAALADYDEALRRDDGQFWADITLFRATALTHCGRSAEAVEQCRAPLSNRALRAFLVYEGAVALAYASVAPELPAPERETAAVRSVETVRRLLKLNRGYRRVVTSQGVFAPLRLRADFRAVLAEK